jgi:hypothetical protein|tara:strand:+ start:26 stop:862 length:837 start_codon:yes stop_codon:yes gene_type:complete
MDLNAIKNRLASLNQDSKPKNKEKKDYTLVYWKPRQEGKYQIRFVPSKLNKNNPFQEIFMHYGVGKYPIVALTNWGENDPVVDFTKKLRTTSDSENWRLAKKLDPKMRVFAPVIVRGEEDKGVRLFEFSKTLYLELLSVADDEDYGDFTDVSEGFDFVVTATKVQDRPGFQLGLRPKPKQTPLSKEASQIETWLENQPVLLEERYKYTYDKLKEELQNFLTEDVNTEDSIVSEPAAEFDGDTKTVKEEKKFSLATQGAPKKAKSEEFDSLFEDDGLPF